MRKRKINEKQTKWNEKYIENSREYISKGWKEFVSREWTIEQNMFKEEERSKDGKGTLGIERNRERERERTQV